MTIDHSLAFKLKEEGFPQEGEGIYIPLGDKPYLYEPYLEEIIEAIGDEFKCLRNFRHEMWAAHGKLEGERQYQVGWSGSNEWIAEAVSTYTTDEGTTSCISAHGKTAKEASARLYIKIHTV